MNAELIRLGTTLFLFVESIAASNDLSGQTSDSICKTCESGKEPTGDQKACVLIGEQASKYFERTSGLCTDDGGSLIGTKEDWEKPVSLGTFALLILIFFLFLPCIPRRIAMYVGLTVLFPFFSFRFGSFLIPITS